MTIRTTLSKSILASAGASVALLSVTPAFAQYDRSYQPPAYDYDRAPPGYNGTQPPPPPPGYQPATNARQLAEQDRYYADRTQRWAAENCVKSSGNAVGGALVGGLLGAILGHSVGSRGDKGTSTVAGAVIGGVGGAALGSSSDRRTSPGCPPGYVMRRSARPFYYETDYVYAAPPWYRPWSYYEGRWVYRPYPYHDYYARQYRGYGHPEWHDHYEQNHDERGHDWHDDHDHRGW